MVHSRRKKSNNPDCLVDDVKAVLQVYVKQGDHLIVGLSGGVDSIVLLDILSTVSRQMRLALSAAHVNHGISRHSVAWSHFCCRQCYAYGIPVSVRYAKVKNKPGSSLEAVAREKRYGVFSRLPGDYLVLAQHQDDQAETLLLQLLRGAGVRGLSAMPVVRKQTVSAAPSILRPLLNISRADILAYARQRGLDWIHDESNDDCSFNRNFLRHALLPVLNNRYPAYAKTLQRTSQHMAEASQLLDELAEVDAQNCVIAGNLYIPALRKLNRPRAKNLLRYLLHEHNIPLPSTVKLDEILNQLRYAKKDAQLRVTVGDAEVRCFKDYMYILLQQKRSPKHLQRRWQGEPSVRLTELGGVLRFVSVQGQGLSAHKLRQSPVFIKVREGGEYFMPDCKRPRRSLKNLLQEASIPPWQRFALPLLFCGEKLAWVPGIGTDCALQAASGEMGIVPEWRLGNFDFGN
ncbi:tRNA(Ile)-lysidine synthase [Nitrosomonas sp. Nm51]|uniref:tRNA lysidine(34) synthetase TilS n=1 Tax=Nitrosomonas sp. Nm51 TaxID=133720 RepID=UPI0008C98249|nr:tRNA lysidine(34) synthetase TilS [Nitrosomonas sp. Nm51]SER36370.1 tRNA(Ile)-lysidine synthase [Nitrosomonas sp. Nm51]